MCADDTGKATATHERPRASNGSLYDVRFLLKPESPAKSWMCTTETTASKISPDIPRKTDRGCLRGDSYDFAGRSGFKRLCCPLSNGQTVPQRNTPPASYLPVA